MFLRQRQKVQEVLRGQVALLHLFACAAPAIHGKIGSSVNVENLFK
jgi:hypothetical protein